MLIIWDLTLDFLNTGLVIIHSPCLCIGTDTFSTAECGLSSSKAALTVDMTSELQPSNPSKTAPIFKSEMSSVN